MDESKDSGFNIGLDQPGPEREPEAETVKLPQQPKRQKKPAEKSKKQGDSAVLVLFIGVLVLCLLLGWGYYDIRQRLSIINTSGSEEVARLSRRVNTQLTDLENTVSAIKKAREKDLADLENRMEDTASSVKQLRSSISSFEENLGGFRKKLAPLEEQMTKQGGQLAGMQERVAEIDGLKKNLAAHTDKISSLSASLEELSNTKVTPETLDKALEKQRQNFKNNMAHATAAFNSEISSLQNRLQSLSGNLEGLEEKIEELQQAVEAKNAAGKKGEIIEQEIQ
ncbi:MAG: hypothetical protein R6X08_04075 [Desulfosalsimonadaceae bacterium]